MGHGKGAPASFACGSDSAAGSSLAWLDCKRMRVSIEQTCPAEPQPSVVNDVTTTESAIAAIAVQGCWCSAIERGAAGGSVASAATHVDALPSALGTADAHEGLLVVEVRMVRAA